MKKMNDPLSLFLNLGLGFSIAGVVSLVVKSCFETVYGLYFFMSVGDSNSAKYISRADWYTLSLYIAVPIFIIVAFFCCYKSLAKYKRDVFLGKKQNLLLWLLITTALSFYLLLVDNREIEAQRAIDVKDKAQYQQYLDEYAAEHTSNP